MPPCTPTRTSNNLAEDKSQENEPQTGEDPQEEDEGGVGKEDNSQSLLMGIVSQIAAEPTVDYKKDIWQLQLRDLRKACLECIHWPHTKQLPRARSETATGSMWRVLFLFAYQVGLNCSHFVDGVTWAS